ncbi:MAG: 4Fe-4S dicluster domain-containing protein [Candidatus Saliniplasma sp.]
MAECLKIRFDRELCTGCGICIRFCPKDVLGESDELNQYGNHYPKVKNLQACIKCRRCELYCPDFAIFVENEEEK